MEAKCWTCARAYARPDPQGCVYIRSDGQIKVEGSEIKYLKPESIGNNHRQMVVMCPNYDRSGRTPEPKPKKKKENKIVLAKIFCKYCGEEIQEIRSHNTAYCDSDCRRAARLKVIADAAAITRPPRPCALCGEMYQPPKVTSMYCSKPECRKARDDMYKQTYRDQRKKPAQRGPGEAIEGSRETL